MLLTLSMDDFDLYKTVNGTDAASETDSETSLRQAGNDYKDQDDLSSSSSESNEISSMSQNQEIVNDLFSYYTEQVKDITDR